MTADLTERTQSATKTTAPRRPEREKFTRRTPLFYLIPALVALVGFAGYPLFVLVRMAFSDVGPTNIVGEWNFVGGTNLQTVLADPEFWASLLRTAQLTIVLLVANLLVGFVIASVLSTKGRLTNIVLGVMVFVWALPPLVSGSVWRFMLDSDGAVNAVIGLVGIEPVEWLASPDVSLWAVAGVLAWSGLPFSVLVLRGGLLAISPDVIEAAALDGATWWRTQMQVVLPLMRPTMWILGILTILYAFKSFDFIYVLTQGGPGTVTSTLPVYSYFTAFRDYDMSVGAAIAVLTMVIVALLAIPYVRSVRVEASE